MIALVHGPDRFLAREAALAIAAEVDPEGANTSWLDGRETPMQRIIGAIGSVSFFGAPRVVVVSDLLARAGGDTGTNDGGSETAARPSRGASEIAALVAATPPTHCLIFFEPALHSAPAAFKTAAPDAKVIAGEPPRGAALVAWIVAAMDRAGTRGDRRTAQLLAQTLYPQTWDRKPNNPRFDRPPDLALLTNEIAKLAAAAHPEPIAAEHIRALVAGGPDQRLFRFTDAALAGDLRGAFVELERLLAAGEEPAMLLAHLLGQVELSAVAVAAGGRDSGEVARDLTTVTPSRMSAVMASARKQSRHGGLEVAGGVAIDRGLKTGRLRRPEDALHDLILALATARVQQTGRP